MKADSTNKRMKNKPYNMAIIDNDSAEINMYGEVVSEVPADLWTGERLGGYIGADEFIEDLEEIKDKKNITIHINSGGGDLYAGLAIYNRMKALKGTVTTINDGLAASAASLIFQAGNIRKMNAGSNLMAHGASGFLFGYYNLDNLKTLMNEYKAHNKAVVNVYAEAMGVSYEEAKSFVQGENWMTGQEAVDKGLADEVIEEEEDIGRDSMLGRMMNRILTAYGVQKPMANSAAVLPVANITTEGGEEVEIKNEKDLREAYPEYVAQIENAAKNSVKEENAAKERARIAGIEAIEAQIPDKELVKNAKYGENPITAEQLALEAMKAQNTVNAGMLDALNKDPEKSGTVKIKGNPAKAEEDEEDEEEEVDAEAKNLASTYMKIKNGGRK